MLQRQEESGEEEPRDFHRFEEPPVRHQDTFQEGPLTYTDAIRFPEQRSDTGVISGRIERTVTAPASGSLPSEDVSGAGRMNVSFDPSPRNCAVTIPLNYHFEQAEPEYFDTCDEGPAPAPLPPTAFNALKANVVSVVNHGLNGWFDVRLSGSGCPSGCTDRQLPILVVAEENDERPRTDVTIVNRPGRSSAGTVCARSWNETTGRHEGGHQVLGVGDEYPETDEQLRAVSPQLFRPERVRRDYSVMGPESDSRYALFHERHFAGVTTFLEYLYPGCTATLVANARPIIPDYRINLGAGFAAVSGLPGGFVRAGLDFGIPLDRMRRWLVTLGPEFTAMLARGDEHLQTALLLGVRIGLEGSFGDAGFGVTGGPFISAGYGWFSSSDRTGIAPRRDAHAAYGEVGARFGIRTELGAERYNLGIEGAAGTALGAPGVIGPIGPDIASDPARTHWFRVGLGASVQF